LYTFLTLFLLPWLSYKLGNCEIWCFHGGENSFCDIHYVFMYDLFNIIRSSDCSVRWYIISEWWIGSDVEGNSCGLPVILSTILVFSWKDWPWKPVMMAYLLDLPNMKECYTFNWGILSYCGLITVCSLVGGNHLLIGTYFVHLPLLSCKWKQDVHSKHWYPPITQHGVTTQETTIWKLDILVLKILSWWCKRT
jgi:hypothetical protein